MGHHQALRRIQACGAPAINSALNCGEIIVLNVFVVSSRKRKGSAPNQYSRIRVGRSYLTNINNGIMKSVEGVEHNFIPALVGHGFQTLRKLKSPRKLPTYPTTRMKQVYDAAHPRA
jgi:hypothetical protein